PNHPAASASAPGGTRVAAEVPQTSTTDRGRDWRERSSLPFLQIAAARAADNPVAAVAAPAHKVPSADRPGPQIPPCRPDGAPTSHNPATRGRKTDRPRWRPDLPRIPIDFGSELRSDR